MEINNKNAKDFYKNLIDLCRTGNVDSLQNIINSDSVKKITKPIPDKMLVQASGHGQFEIVKVILESTHLKNHLFIGETLKEAIGKAFEYGHENIVEYLVPKLDAIGHYHIGIISHGLTLAIRNGKLDIAKHFLENSPLIKNINKDSLLNEMLKTACIYNQVELVKHIVEKNKLSEQPSWNKKLANHFWNTYGNKSYDVMQYFIFDLDIPKTSDIENLLITNNDTEPQKLNDWFNIREARKTLEKELDKSDSISPSTIKKPKI